ncbi:MAG: hypothetical protein EXR49_03900 [Dehalococcoidia bacterium]|nr:hypothetical protein [Dehalococcoidia bacterium]
MRRRLAKVAWVLLLLAALFFNAGDSYGPADPIAGIVQPEFFSVSRWETGNFLKKWTHQAGELRYKEETDANAVLRVHRYFYLARRIAELRDRVEQATTGFVETPDLPAVRRELAAAEREAGRSKPRVEETIEGMLDAVLRDGGVRSSFLWLDWIWPPVDFRLDAVPRVLVISPRERIEIARTTLIDPRITIEGRVALESEVDARNLSSIVLGISGVASYPSLVPETFALRDVLRVAAHEWTHHYLAFHPLGRAYRKNGDLTALNETVADVVGDEVGDLVYQRYFAAPGEVVTPPRRARPATPPAPSDVPPPFDFNAAMRETRVRAEELLAQGKIDEAESHMEERRHFMAEHGYYFRKLNQAFFAFNGAYASRAGSGSVSPIGGQITGLRDSSATLGEFLSAIARYGSYDALKRGLGLRD